MNIIFILTLHAYCNYKIIISLLLKGVLLILRLAKRVLLVGTWSLLPDSPREDPAVFMVPEMHHLTFSCDYHAAIDPST